MMNSDAHLMKQHEIDDSNNDIVSAQEEAERVLEEADRDYSEALEQASAIEAEYNKENCQVI